MGNFVANSRALPQGSPRVCCSSVYIYIPVYISIPVYVSCVSCISKSYCSSVHLGWLLGVIELGECFRICEVNVP